MGLVVAGSTAAGDQRLIRPSVPARLRARHARVLLFFARVFLEALATDVLLRRLGLRRWAKATAAGRYGTWARRYRALAARLGGLWIKAGQFLSARVDVLPDAITAELAHLQDEVAPEPVERILAVVVGDLGQPVETAFASFEREPLASASLGQVHRARLNDGSAVVVKVLRPGIEAILAVDLAALQTVIAWLKRWQAIRRRANLDALFDEFSRTLWDEVDYIKEAEHARRFGVMFADQPDVRIPRVLDERSTRRVLTLEDVYFIKITDYEVFEARGVSRKEVAARLFRTYMHQIFEVGFFHADPHPGNLFVEVLPAVDGQAGVAWRLVFVDFGMVGQLSAQVREALRDMAIAFGTRDLDRLMRAYEALGVLLPDADRGRVRQAQAAMFDYVWGKTIRELMRTLPRDKLRFASEFRDLMYQMPFQVPTDLIFLGRCIAVLSGMCTGLDPEFNLFGEIAPFARKMLAEEGGGFEVEAALEWVLAQLRLLAGLPGRLDGVLGRMERGELTVVARAAPELERELKRMTGAINRLAAAVLVAAVILAIILLTAR
ncbi:MAG TPA: AarF/UbiB family protein [Anaerolineales bacterium]|nr:AarF/UbiB family protein [Anaerolineales bacterium]